MRDQINKEIRWDSKQKPAMGGITFYITFLVSLILYHFICNDTHFIDNKTIISLFVVLTIGFIAGLIDDSFNTKPLLKFSSQLLCAIILIVTGNYIKIFNNELLNYFITILWVVGMMNSVNMLDNMDGIVTICSSIVLIALIIKFFIIEFNFFYLITIISILASLIAFLFYNWHPSKLYMGDTGSQFLGIYLASITIPLIWNNDYISNSIDFEIPKFIRVTLLFTPFIFDTTIVTINRLSKGKSPFVGGKDHTTHYLSRYLKSDKKTALIFLTISLFSASIFLYTIYLKEFRFIDYLITITYLISIFFFLFSFTRKL